MSQALDAHSLDQLFRTARTHNGFIDKPVPDQLLKELFDLVKMAPTSANCSPMRLVFVRTKEGKEKLRPALSSGNLEKTIAAPVTVIVAYDQKFYDHLPKLFPHTDARPWFTSSPAFAEQTAFRNGSLQGGYLILAARALGLDTGPMSGFKNDLVDEAFFAGTSWKSNFLCNLGYGDPSKLFGRSPRFEFDDVCKLA